MTTITVDILKDEAIGLLKDLEALNVIRVHARPVKKEEQVANLSLSEKYKGSISKQSRQEVEQQLYNLRKEWD